MKNSKMSERSFHHNLILFFGCFIFLMISCSTDSMDDSGISDENSDTEQVDHPSSDDESDSDNENDQQGEQDGDEQDNEEQDGDEQDDTSADDDGDEEDALFPCTDPGQMVFIEKDGLVHAEFENAQFSGDWNLKTQGDFSGKGYMVWEGGQHLGNPGNAPASFKIRITNPGTYQFIWKSAVKIGNSGTDHNDTWLRFNDADDFYAQKDGSVVYPKDSGKSPNPEGASKDGWFKIYRSGNNLDFKWQAKTFDNNAHNIFVVFNEAGTYTMEVSVRSSGHAIDRFALFNASHSEQNAISDERAMSEITCN